MNPRKLRHRGDANEKVSALIATLHETEQRLEELTAGEVDTVADRDGRTLLLRRAQDQLRHREAAKQAAILNALPAHIALLDTHGLIISVNEAWRRFARANVLQGPGYGIGLNYLEICDSARGDQSCEAHQVAEGIRSVLAGRAKSFSIEYPCHSPTEQRWFLLTVTPLADDRPNGAVVMHLDITERRRTQVTLAQSEAGLHRAQLMSKLAHVITGPDGSFEQWSETLPQLVGIEPADLPRTTRAWLDILHPDDRSLFRDKAIEASVKKLRMELEYRLRRSDGEWIHVRQTMEPLKGEAEATSGTRWFNTLQDVTVERRTEESLRDSELRFRQMAENIGDVFFLQNLDSSQIYYVSPAYEQIWGRTCESLYANPASWADSIHPDDLDHAFTKFNEGRNTGFDYEFRIVRPDGEIRWIHVRGFPILDDAGVPYRTAGVASDITQRKQAAEELRRSESLKGAILESSLDCLITIDHEGKIVEFNPAAEATFGFTREQALGKVMVDLIVPPRLRDAHRRGFAHYLATDKGPILGKRLELEAIRADGTAFPIELAIVALGGTSTPMFTGFIRDITERKRASDDLRESERRFSDVLGNVEMVSLMLDREARITYCNEFLLRLTGWRHEEVIGRNWFELFIPPETNDAKDKFVALLANLPEAWHHENQILTRSGERRFIHWNNSILRSGAGDVIGTASIGEDVTERKMADEVLKIRAAELERFHRLSVGRELQMIELKKQINELAKQAGEKPPYDLAFLSPEPVRTNSGHEKIS